MYFTGKMGKIVCVSVWSGLMGRKQAAVLVAILMEKGGRRRQAWWGQSDAATHQARRGRSSLSSVQRVVGKYFIETDTMMVTNMSTTARKLFLNLE